MVLRSRLLALLPWLALTACSNLPPAPEMARLQPEARACADWFEQLDQQVDARGVRDASSHRVAGHPYLRADRFTASLAGAASEPGPAFDRWVERLRALDLQARDAELRQLMPAGTAAPQALAHAETCGQTLLRADLATAAGRERLARSAQVPDDYAGWVHTSGVFAVASLPFTMGVRGWYREAQQMFDDTAASRAHGGPLRRIGPAQAQLPPAQVSAIFARTPRDALGVPTFSPADEAQLFSAYAPHYEVETSSPADRFGALHWQAGQAAPQVDSSRPVVYRRLAFTQMQGRVLTQLVYTAWFPERPKAHGLDLLGGALDGLVMRVTLGDDGQPLIWDTIHPCGCYHMFFPTPALRELPPPPAGSEEWTLSPTRLPALQPGDRLAVRTAASTHYLVAVAPASPAPRVDDTYLLQDENDLRTLPLPGGGVRSIYGPDALVAGSERGERLFFWPMGIASPGTMRQWGRHPTAFLDRRHFDDADLLDKRFAPTAPGARP